VTIERAVIGSVRSIIGEARTVLSVMCEAK